MGLVAILYCAGYIGRPYTEGWLAYVLNCYYNDILAGVAILAWTNLAMVHWGGREPLSRRQNVLMLLACGVAWECLAPLWKAGAVFDPIDFLAYQLGGALYCIFSKPIHKK